MKLKIEDVLMRLERVKSLMEKNEKEACERMKSFLVREDIEEFLNAVSKTNLSLDYLFLGDGNINLSFLMKELINELNSLPQNNAEIIIKTMIDFAKKLKNSP